MSNYFVGQRVFSLNIGNKARHQPQALSPYIITKIGKKYFYARPEGRDESFWEQAYHIESGMAKTEYSPNSVIYISEQEWFDEQETINLHKKIKEIFHFKNTVSLDKLRKIDAILRGCIIKH